MQCIDAAYCYKCRTQRGMCVCVSVCPCVGHMGELCIQKWQMPFGGQLMWVQGTMYGALLRGHVPAIVEYRNLQDGDAAFCQITSDTCFQLKPKYPPDYTYFSSV